jgi:hypothetical protein
MLPKYYKIRVYNDAGVSVTVQADWLPFKVGSSGLSYGTNSSVIASGSVSSAAAATSSAQDNSSNGYEGGHLTLYATPGSAPSGNKRLLVYLLGSNDNTTFEDLQATVGEGYGNLVGTMNLTGTSALHLSLEVAA